MAHVIRKFVLQGQKPTLDQAAGALGVQKTALDRSFGVAAINPVEGLWCVRVEESALPRESVAAA
jgi:hypothetical protein